MMTLVGAPPDHYLEYSKMKDMISKFLLKDHVLQTGSSMNIKDDNHAQKNGEDRNLNGSKH